MIHKWHSAFSKNRNDGPLYEKKVSRPQTSITKRNINTIQAVTDDQYLSTMSPEALLHIPWIIIHCILTERLLDTTQAHKQSNANMHRERFKISGLITEDSTNLNQVVTSSETWEHHYDPLTKWKVSIGRGKMNRERKRSGSRSQCARSR